MVYKFKLVSDEVSNFSREIEIDAGASFLELRNVILDSVGYTRDELDSFFICDDDWTRHEEITLEEMDSSSDQDIWLMDDTILNDMLEDEGQKLMFVFDYLTERSFFMELKEIVPGHNLKEPVCTLMKGKAPEQHVSLEEFETKIDQAAAAIKEDMDMDFYGDEQFDEDELPEGFDEMS